MFQNRDTGEVLNYFDARMQWMRDYDGEDNSDCVSFEEMYSVVKE